MADENLKELIEGIKQNKKKLDVQSDVNKTQLDFITKLLGFLLAILAFLAFIFGVFLPANSINSETQEIIYKNLVWIALPYFILFIAFYAFYSRYIISNISKTYTHLESVMRIFLALENNYKEKTEELNKQIIDTKETAKNIANSPLSNLISWQQSGIMEIDATTIFSISIDLSWVNNEERLNLIFKDLEENIEDKYYYILITNSDMAIDNYDAIKSRLKIERGKNKIVDIDKRFQIAKLSDLKKGNKKIYENENFLLPLPNDLVIYKIPNLDPIAVISTETITNKRTITDLNFKYDIKFTDVDQVKRIDNWFKKTWFQITNDPIE